MVHKWSVGDAELLLGNSVEKPTRYQGCVWCLEQTSATWKLPPHKVDEDPEKDEDNVISQRSWSVVLIPFTSDFCGGFRADCALGSDSAKHAAALIAGTGNPFEGLGIWSG